MVERILARTSSRETQSVVTSRRRVFTRSRAMAASLVSPISVTADSFWATASSISSRLGPLFWSAAEYSASAVNRLSSSGA
jgi:hypothetical protein